MSNTLNIQIAQRQDAKSQFKNALGFVASILFRRRFVQLSSNPVGQPEGLADKVMMSLLKRQAMSNGDDKFFESLHKDFWQGEGGEAFSSNCDHRFQDLFLNQQKEDFIALQNQWRMSDLNRIVEFGCNSGLVLNYLTQHLPGVIQSQGIEINQTQVDANVDSNQFDNRIQFFCADGGDWLLQNGRPHTLFVSNGGVLEYFRRDRLDEMLTYIANNLKPALFFAIEPVAPDHDWKTTKESVPFGEELSFSHNYIDLFSSNGFEIVHQRATDFESWRMMATIAKTSSN